MTEKGWSSRSTIQPVSALLSADYLVLVFSLLIIRKQTRDDCQTGRVDKDWVTGQVRLVTSSVFVI